MLFIFISIGVYAEMRQLTLRRSIRIAVVVSLFWITVGCENKSEPAGPEMGAIEAYLQEHPEERESDPSEAQSAQDEFDASR